MHIENLNEVPYFQNMIKAIKSGSVEGGVGREYGTRGREKKFFRGFGRKI